MVYCCKCGKQTDIGVAMHCSHCGKDYCPQCAASLMCECSEELSFYS